MKIMGKKKAKASKASAKKTIKARDIISDASDFLPTRVSEFDDLIDKGGLERGSILLISGGCGSGKSVFAMQSAYEAAKAGENVVYFTFDEAAEKVRKHAKENFGWEFAKFEDAGNLALQQINPEDIALSIETMSKKSDVVLSLSNNKACQVAMKEVSMPFKPDRVIIDSISALSVAFSDKIKYRAYLNILFDSLRSYNAVTMIITEAEQEPNIFSRSGIEEFLVDGVTILYNIRKDGVRNRAIEILKLRFSDHEKKLVPFNITSKGVEIYKDEQLF